MQEFSFDFFSELYKNLSSPALTGDDDCQFFSWDFSEFRNLGQVFEMDPDRSQMRGNYTPWYSQTSHLITYQGFAVPNSGQAQTCQAQCKEFEQKIFLEIKFFGPKQFQSEKKWGNIFQ